MQDEHYAMMDVTFLGAAGTVTGSKLLVDTAETRILVDCGLYQGIKSLRLRNWAPLVGPRANGEAGASRRARGALIEPSSIDAVVLTHAHIDHSGYLPKLVADGFRGPVYASPPTVELAKILLPDAGHLQEEDAAYSNRRGFSKHRPALPLFDEAAARVALRQLVPLELGARKRIGDLEIRLSGAGHILGAASVTVTHAGRSLLVSGDLGRSDDLLMYPPESPDTAHSGSPDSGSPDSGSPDSGSPDSGSPDSGSPDSGSPDSGSPDWIVIESTYGDRLHPAIDPIETVAALMRRTFARGGTVLIPSFAVGRAQALLFCLYEIFRRDLAPRVPVYVNSPMATNVTKLYAACHEYHRLTETQYARVYEIAEYVLSVEESKALGGRRGPMVILSASGMATGGRVLHHLKRLAPDPRNTVLLPGFQAPGTRGDALARGARDIKIHGRYVRVEAEVVQMHGLSAHADQRDLLEWLDRCKTPPREVFVVHGEPSAADALRCKIAERGIAVRVPEYREWVPLEA
jgi:metallo-beta-lactamase family protein